MSEIDELKEEIKELKSDVNLLLKYTVDRIHDIADHTGDATFDKELAERCQGFVRRHGLKTN